MSNSKYQSRRRYANGKLKTWIQGRCIVCQRFLSKVEHKWCRHCYPNRETLKIYRESFDWSLHTSVRCYSMQSLRESIDFDIPTFLRKELWGYY